MNSDSKSNPNPDTLSDATAALQARPAFRPSADWTRHLRPVDAPIPDWAKPKPPAGAGAANSASVFAKSPSVR